jgi:hypothetical protein
MMTYLSELRLIGQVIKESNRNPVDYLNLFFKLASIIHHLIFIKMIWSPTKSQEFLRIVNTLWCSNKFDAKRNSNGTTKSWNKWTIFCVCNVYFCMAIVSQVTGRALDPLSRTSFFKWLQEIRYIIFLPKSDTMEIGTIEILFLIFHRIVYTARRVMGFGTDAWILMVTLTLWLPSKYLSHQIKEESTVNSFYTLGRTKSVGNIGDTLSFFETLKELSDQLNEAVGVLPLSSILEGTLFYSVALKSVVVLNASGAMTAFFFVSFFATFYIAVDTCHRVSLPSTDRWLVACQSSDISTFSTLFR